MSPSVIDLTGSKRPPKGTQFVLSEEGARVLNSSFTHPVVKPGEILVYPGDELLNSKMFHSIWMNSKENLKGMQVPYDKDLFERAIYPSKQERR